MSLVNLGALDSTLLCVLGLLCLVLMAVTLLRRWQFRRIAARDITRDDRGRLRQQRELHQSLTELAAQLEGLSRRLENQAEVQLAKLSAALAAADERIKRLGAAPPVPDVPSAAPPVTSGRGGASPDLRDPRLALGTRLENVIRQRVYELADLGRTPGTIADTLHVPIGEVELLLNLRAFERRGAVRTPA